MTNPARRPRAYNQRARARKESTFLEADEEKIDRITPPRAAARRAENLAVAARKGGKGGEEKPDLPFWLWCFDALSLVQVLQQLAADWCRPGWRLRAYPTRRVASAYTSALDV